MLKFRIIADATAEGPRRERAVEVELRDQLTIGRRLGADIELPFVQVSAAHARIRATGPDQLVVMDLGSANGTFVNQRRLLPNVECPLVPGDVLRLARVSLVFEGDVPPSAAGEGLVEGTTTLARRLVGDLFAMCQPAQSTLLAVEGGRDDRKHVLLSTAERLWRVGRGPACHLVLADPDVSREHAELLRSAEGIILRDLGSKNGLLVNDRLVEGQVRLRDGDLVQMGNTLLRFEDPEDRYLRQMEQAAGDQLAASLPPGLSPPAHVESALPAGADASATPFQRSSLVPSMAMILAVLALLGAGGVLLAVILTWNR